MEKVNRLKELDFVINIDMVGYNLNGVVELKMEPDYEEMVASLSYSYTKLKPKITLGAWGSDHVPFLKRSVSSILTIEDWSTKTPCYHQSCEGGGSED